MSSDERRPLTVARAIAAEAALLIADVVDNVVIAGSIRREKATVGDIELVALVQDSRRVGARLDKLVLDGTISKARYGDSYRWGDKYRGFIYGGMRVELFCADKNNWGYVLWLRTGPGDANTAVMTMLARANSPYRASEGYWWRDGRKMRVADEAEMFRLLGMRLIAPANRNEGLYLHYLRGFRPVDDVVWADDEPPAPIQNTLF